MANKRPYKLWIVLNKTTNPKGLFVFFIFYLAKLYSLFNDINTVQFNTEISSCAGNGCQSRSSRDLCM